MADLDHLLGSYNVRDELDDIASADPPAYLRRCFAEGISAPELNRARVQQLAVCAMVHDSIVHDRDYESLEPELMSDWRAHFALACSRMRELAAAALRRAREALGSEDPDAVADLEDLEHRLGAA